MTGGFHWVTDPKRFVQKNWKKWDRDSKRGETIQMTLNFIKPVLNNS